MAFHVGQKVVCINASSETGRLVRASDGALCVSSGEMHGLREGAVYTIRSFAPPYYVGHPELVILDEIQRRGAGPSGFNKTRFRPVVERKTSIAIFTEDAQAFKGGCMSNLWYAVFFTEAVFIISFVALIVVGARQ